MSTPIETAAEAMFERGMSAQRESEPEGNKDGWRSDAEAALASLAQHRDDIARAVLIARQESDERKALAEKVWQRAKDGEMSWDVRDRLLRDVDAMLAFISDGAR